IIKTEKIKPVKTIERSTFVSQSGPLTLSQMQNVAPKKFKHSRKKPNLSEIRNIIQSNKE
ncbi:hypothetical protein ACFLY1_01030, partial [Patescibacteria group bacterium]